MEELKLATEKEVPVVFDLIKSRIAWMDEVGIKGWNMGDYTKIFPESYYHEKMVKNELYVLKEDNQIISGLVLLEEDARWENPVGSAYYIHNFTSSPTHRGAGKIMLSKIEELALQNGKEYVRLDCSVNNNALNQYYEKNGYLFAGYGQEGPYKGILRQKKIQ